MMDKNRHDYINNGAVIDHVPVARAVGISRLLKLGRKEIKYSIADYCDSKKHARKGIIKIWEYAPNEKDMDLIAITAPNATISVIKQGEVEKKIKPKASEILDGVINCLYGGCITHAKGAFLLPSKLHYKDGKLKCDYCKSIFSVEELLDR